MIQMQRRRSQMVAIVIEIIDTVAAIVSIHYVRMNAIIDEAEFSVVAVVIDIADESVRLNTKGSVIDVRHGSGRRSREWR